MQASLSDIVERLRQGEDPAALALSLLPRGERELLRACALVRAFDRPLVEQVLAPALGGDLPAFDAIARHRDVEPVAAMPGAFRVQDRARRDLWLSWWDEAGSTGRPPVPEPLVVLSRRLADHFGAAGPEGRDDLLHQLLVADGEGALRLFDTLYEEADARFDLPRCQTLLDIVAGRQALLNPAFERRYQDRVSYRRARGLWSLHYDQTFHYLERYVPRRRFDALMQDPQRWILVTHARGGLGKTMFVRWALSRYCAPEPRRIPCAYVDFDSFSPVVASTDPWYLVYRLAVQLNEQVPGNPLYELIGAQREPVARLSGAGGSGSPGLDPAERSVLNQALPEQVARILATTWGDRPLMIVLDTLEQVLLRPGTDLMATLRALEPLREHCPGTRLILSGRYRPRERVAGFVERYGGVSCALRVRPFRPAESRAYLMDIRGLSDRETADAIARRARGNPFKLALLADLVRADPTLTAERLRAYADEDVAYLIERVVERVDDQQVRWIIRHGAIPRRLTLRFVADVMQPHLRRVMAGDTREDLPSRTLSEHQGGVFRTDLLPSPDTPIDLEAAWHTLVAHAADYAWVTRAPDDHDTLVLHDDVALPMRRLLQNEPILRELHAEAAAYYARLADAEPARWGDWMREAVYHHLQGEGAHGAVFWRRAVHDPRALADPSVRRALAREILAPEYIDDEGEPRTMHDGSPIVDRATVLDALTELARACIAVAGGVEPLALGGLEEAESALARVAQLQQRWGTVRVPPAVLAGARGSARLWRGDLPGAIADLQEAAGARLEPLPPHYDAPTLRLERARAAVALVDALARAGRSGAAIDAAGKARARLRHDMVGAPDAPAQHARLGWALASAGQLHQAVQEYRVALDAPGASPQRPRWTREMGAVLTQAGQWGAGIRALEPAARGAGAAPFDRESALAGVFLARARVEAADVEGGFAAASAAVAAAESASATPEGRVVLAHCWEVRGEVLAALRRFGAAMSDWEQARSLFAFTGDAEGAARCLLLRAQVQMREAGEGAEADRLLAELLAIQNEALAFYHVVAATLAAERVSAGEAPSALAVLPPRGDLVSRRVNAVRYARLASAVLGWAPEREAVPILRLLGEALDRVEPMSARFAAIEPLARAPGRAPAASKLLGAFRHRVRLPRPDADDWPDAALRAADLWRTLGDAQTARRLAAGAAEAYSERTLPYGVALAMRARDRAGWGDEDPRAATPRVQSAVEGLAAWPGLAGTVLLAHGERLWTAGALEGVAGMAARAESLIESEERNLPDRARAAHLRARCAVEEGDPRAAGRHLNRARELYERIGDPAGLEAVAAIAGRSLMASPPTSEAEPILVEAEPAPGPLEDPASPLPTDDPESDPARSGITLSVALASGGAEDGGAPLRVELWRRGRESLVWFPPLGPAMAEALSWSGAAPVPPQMLRRVASDPLDAAGLLMRCLFPEDYLEALEGAPPGWLGIDIGARTLESLPWELLPLVLPRSADGQPRVRLFRTARRPRLGRGLELRGQSRILVARPTLMSEQQVTRGYQGSGIDLGQFARSLGLATTVLDRPDPRELADAVAKLEPAVVYLNATIKESPSVGPYLDFAEQEPDMPGSAFARPGSELTGAYLADALRPRGAAAAAAAPIVILDIARAYSAEQEARNLFLRASLACGLYRSGVGEAIVTLATDPRGDPSNLRLLEDIARGQAVGEAVARLRSRLLDGAEPQRADPALLLADAPHRTALPGGPA